MGQHDVNRKQDPRALRLFARDLLDDVRAMEHMLREGMFETDVRRIGAEQELFLVDAQHHPSSVGPEILAVNDDPHLVSELTRFNLEYNLDPQVFEGDCLRRIEEQAHELLRYTRQLAASCCDARVLLTGILPTIHLSDLTLDNLSPAPRYHALNDTLMALRGGPGQFQIRGTDELYVHHDSIMLEGCNTSFQLHLQVAPDEFAKLYNIAQAVAAPVLACAVNSPMLFGKRLWQETRIALFQQAVDTRSQNLYLRDLFPRVHFGTQWLEGSVTDLFKEDIARFPVILTSDERERPFDVLREGGVPRLRALQLHNGTVYRWNRACYGITNGKPHLRIENRILPAGPTIADEMGNAAFWFGLVMGLAGRDVDVTEQLDFDDARTNFVGAARMGLRAQLRWLDGEAHPADDLILHELLPIAREGLEAHGVDEGDISRYLGIVEQRTSMNRTGAEWLLQSASKMRRSGVTTRSERLAALVGATLRHQQDGGDPVHTWELAEAGDADLPTTIRNARVEHLMTTDVFTVSDEEGIDFVASLMNWKRLRHVLVEDSQHRLVGVVSDRAVLRYLSEHGPSHEGREPTAIREIMKADPIHAAPDMDAYAAVELMRREKVGVLPVVRDGHLVGLLTERNFLHLAGRMLDESAGG